MTLSFLIGLLLQQRVSFRSVHFQSMSSFADVGAQHSYVERHTLLDLFRQDHTLRRSQVHLLLR